VFLEIGVGKTMALCGKHFNSRTGETTMIRLRIRLIITLLLVNLAPLTSGWAQKQSNPADVDSPSIKQVVTDWSDAFNRHDSQAAMSFTEDADYTNSRGITMHGRKEIEEHYAVNFAGVLKSAKRTDSVKYIRFLTPEIAAVQSVWQMTGRPDRPLRKGLIDWVMIKRDGYWMVTLFHESELP
jgi:uncharacterized protein (TIGR02246 family)